MTIEIYTKAFCPYCERARELLRIKGLPYVEYQVNDNPRHIDELRRRGGGDGFPVIFIADRLIGGCSDLFELDESGQLDRLLTANP